MIKLNYIEINILKIYNFNFRFFDQYKFNFKFSSYNRIKIKIFSSIKDLRDNYIIKFFYGEFYDVLLIFYLIYYVTHKIIV